MLLVLQHPKVAYRDCDHCQAWQYSEESGQVLKDPRYATPDNPEGMVSREGPTPCRTPQGCPKGTPENPRSLSPRNQICYQHYLECKATGQFPDDPLVRQNAGIIRQVEEMVATARETATQAAMSRLAALGLRRGF